MSHLLTLKTHLRISLGSVEECEVPVNVSFWCHKAWPASSMDPGSDASVEIDSVVAVINGEHIPLRWLPAELTDGNDDLIAECMAEWADADAAARDARDEARRDDAMMDRLS